MTETALLAVPIACALIAALAFALVGAYQAVRDLVRFRRAARAERERQAHLDAVAAWKRAFGLDDKEAP